MLTMEQALTAREFHVGQCQKHVGPRGGIRITQTVYRRNGATKTWKTRPTEYRVPVVHGLRGYGQLTHYNSYDVHTVEECTL